MKEEFEGTDLKGMRDTLAKTRSPKHSLETKTQKIESEEADSLKEKNDELNIFKNTEFTQSENHSENEVENKKFSSVFSRNKNIEPNISKFTEFTQSEKPSENERENKQISSVDSRKNKCNDLIFEKLNSLLESFTNDVTEIETKKHAQSTSEEEMDNLDISDSLSKSCIEISIKNPTIDPKRCSTPLRTGKPLNGSDSLLKHSKLIEPSKGQCQSDRIWVSQRNINSLCEDSTILESTESSIQKSLCDFEHKNDSNGFFKPQPFKEHSGTVTKNTAPLLEKKSLCDFEHTNNSNGFFRPQPFKEHSGLMTGNTAPLLEKKSLCDLEHKNNSNCFFKPQPFKEHSGTVTKNTASFVENINYKSHDIGSNQKTTNKRFSRSSPSDRNSDPKQPQFYHRYNEPIFILNKETLMKKTALNFLSEPNGQEQRPKDSNNKHLFRTESHLLASLPENNPFGDSSVETLVHSENSLGIAKTDTFHKKHFSLESKSQEKSVHSENSFGIAVTDTFHKKHFSLESKSLEKSECPENSLDTGETNISGEGFHISNENSLEMRSHEKSECSLQDDSLDQKMKELTIGQNPRTDFENNSTIDRESEALFAQGIPDKNVLELSYGSYEDNNISSFLKIIPPSSNKISSYAHELIDTSESSDHFCNNNSVDSEISEILSENSSTSHLEHLVGHIQNIDSNIKKLLIENHKQKSHEYHIAEIYKLLMRDEIQEAKKYIRMINGNTEVEVIDNEYNREKTKIKKILIQKQLGIIRNGLKVCAQKMDLLKNISEEMKSDIKVLILEFKKSSSCIRDYSDKILGYIIKSIRNSGGFDLYAQLLAKRNISLNTTNKKIEAFHSAHPQSEPFFGSEIHSIKIENAIDESFILPNQQKEFPENPSVSTTSAPDFKKRTGSISNSKDLQKISKKSTEVHCNNDQFTLDNDKKKHNNYPDDENQTNLIQENRLSDLQIEHECQWLYYELPKNISRILLGIAFLSQQNKRLQNNAKLAQKEDIETLQKENLYLQNSLSRIQEKYLRLKKSTVEISNSISEKNIVIKKAKKLIKKQRESLKYFTSKKKLDDTLEDLQTKIENLRIEINQERNKERKNKLISQLLDYEKRYNDFLVLNDN